MLRKFSEKLLAQLVNEIAVLKGAETDAFKILSGVLKLVRAVMKTLKEELKKHPFKDEAEQIYFFKHLKPLFECSRIYELELYNILTSIPAGDAETIRNFYKEELQAVQRFFPPDPLPLWLLSFTGDRSGQPVVCTGCFGGKRPETGIAGTRPRVFDSRGLPLCQDHGL